MTGFKVLESKVNSLQSIVCPTFQRKIKLVNLFGLTKIHVGWPNGILFEHTIGRFDNYYRMESKFSHDMN